MMIVSATEIKIQSISNIFNIFSLCWNSICLSCENCKRQQKQKKTWIFTQQSCWNFPKKLTTRWQHFLWKFLILIFLSTLLDSEKKNKFSWHLLLGFTSLAKNCFVYDFAIHKTVFLLLVPLGTSHFLIPPFSLSLTRLLFVFILKNNVFYSTVDAISMERTKKRGKRDCVRERAGALSYKIYIGFHFYFFFSCTSYHRFDATLTTTKTTVLRYKCWIYESWCCHFSLWYLQFDDGT